jgi:hypothetical protein
MTDQAIENHPPSPPMGVSSSEGLGCVAPTRADLCRVISAELVDMLDEGTVAACLEDAASMQECTVRPIDVALARALLYRVSGSALLYGDKKAITDARTLYRMVCEANALLIGRVPRAA